MTSWSIPAFAQDAERPRVVTEVEVRDLGTYIDVLTHSWSKVLTLLGFTLIPMFYLVDVFMTPEELLPRFAVVRGVTTAIIVGQHFYLRLTRPTRAVFLHGYFFAAVVGSMIALMTTDLGGFHPTYCAGLNLLMIAVNLLLPWHWIHSLLNSLLIIGLYVGLDLALPQPTELHASLLVNNLYFLSSTAVISVSINYVKQRSIQREFLLRADLDRARDALWGEMEVAKHIQTALLPKIHRVPGCELAAAMIPADEVGGDYYDVVQTDAGETWLCIGDVSGHGIESGLIMMMAQTSIIAAVNRGAGRSPSKVLAEVNAVLRQNIGRLGADRYMTFTALRLDGGEVAFAGLHQDLLVYRAATGTVDEIPTSGTWLGIVDDLPVPLREESLRMSSGDVLVLFTDGITEARNRDGEMFGQARLADTVARHARASADDLVRHVLEEVAGFMAHQTDDHTVVAVRWTH